MCAPARRSHKRRRLARPTPVQRSIFQRAIEACAMNWDDLHLQAILAGTTSPPLAGSSHTNASSSTSKSSTCSSEKYSSSSSSKGKTRKSTSSSGSYSNHSSSSNCKSGSSSSFYSSEPASTSSCYPDIPYNDGGNSSLNLPDFTTCTELFNELGQPLWTGNIYIDRLFNSRKKHSSAGK